ncbi:hypothetical protein SAMN04490189_4589 [Pseudomonas koreensis]|uniref:hypothetical protein n=1 Tax=Pseudomonas koreensis TaxID=198620 RepID=UPI00087CCD1E|nr:hypothetical protein [Pseudomonas koreensis]NNA64329.1 hypothetical protein [Pseudomonas koreensis]GGK46162.1 hypothetical protein GCM10009103_45950 [Pseudomonas koreensis]SDE18361.1 hypothetical protein SAMN04490189_4589 [Pseudomonas koreensis]
MRVIALGALSGATGDREKGEEFTVDAKLGADLISRGLVEPVTEPAPNTEKAPKAKE